MNSFNQTPPIYTYSAVNLCGPCPHPLQPAKHQVAPVHPQAKEVLGYGDLEHAKLMHLQHANLQNNMPSSSDLKYTLAGYTANQEIRRPQGCGHGTVDYACANTN